MAGERAQEIGRMIARAAKSGGAQYVNGITTAAPASGRITVDLGHRVVPATIPGTFRTTLAAGQDVQLVVQGSQYVVNAVLSTLPTPAVDATSTSGLSDPEYLIDAGYSMAGFTAQDVVLTNYAEYVAEHLIATNAVVADLAATVAQLRQALIDQGNVQ